MNIYCEYLPAEYSAKLREAKFNDIFAAFYTYVKPLAPHIKAHDAEFLLKLIETVKIGFDAKKVFNEGLDDALREKFWRYAEWFLQWFDEYVAV